LLQKAMDCPHLEKKSKVYSLTNNNLQRELDFALDGTIQP